MIVSLFLWTLYRNVTDRQMDGRTESLWLLQRSALRTMRTRCKKNVTVSYIAMFYTANFVAYVGFRLRRRSVGFRASRTASTALGAGTVVPKVTAVLTAVKAPSR